ncbi:MAG TPA: serine/threonine-protein kinase, partial [Ktedonobacteraceae bacterium]|nr:serine/threonine-protein kinase [Ktedonobacteraceae bacterium]
MQAPSANDGDNRDAALNSRLAAGSLLQERYKIVQEVGTGGFGSVYRASDTLFGNRMVAIKEIRLQGLKPNEVIDATDTFNREASILSELRHPNLPRIYDSFTAPEHWYLVMDFIDGETLETYLDKIGGRLLPDEVLEIGIQLCTVLDYLHSRQTPVIFRDLKPTNIMITTYKQVYLIDFGAARYFKPGRSRDTIAFGSPGYASPEQYGKAQTTARSDIYSLGATLHEALTGKDPGETPFKFSFTPRMAGVTIPPDLEDLILRMVEMDASKRPASARAVKEELQRISMQHLRRLYPLPTHSSPIYHPPFAQGQPPPASWATSAPSVRQAQMQLGLPPTPTAPKRNVTRRAMTTMILVGIAGAALVENTRWLWSQPDQPYAPPQAMTSYSLSQQGTFNGHNASVTSLAWSDQVNVVASGSKDGTIKVWNPFAYDTYTTHTLSHAQVSGVAWSPGGSYVAATSTDKAHPVAVWGDFGQSDAAPTTYAGSGAMNTIAWSPQDSMLATGGEDSVVRILEQDGSTLKHTVSYAGHTGQVQSLAWSSDANYLASASVD